MPLRYLVLLLTLLAGEMPKSREVLLRAELILRNSVTRPPS